MTAQEHALLAHSSNGAFALEAEAESRKERKKKKKKQKKAQQHARQELLARMNAEHPRLDGVQSAELGKTAVDPAQPALRIQAWLRQVSASLDTQRILTAHKSSYLIAINCVMLSIAAHSIYRGLAAGPLQWVLIPLALTNVLSLTFAILSAQVKQHTSAIDQLWAMPADDYEPAVTSMLQNRKRAYETLSSDLHELGAELSQRQKHLRSAYRVLLGGVAASACLFALSAAMAAGA